MTLQQEIIQALGAKPQIDAEGEIRPQRGLFEVVLADLPFY